VLDQTLNRVMQTSSARWDAYTIAIAASAVAGVALIAYSLMSGNAAPAPKPVQIAAIAPAPATVQAQVSAPAASSAQAVAPAAKTVAMADTKTVNEPSPQEVAQKNAAFDRFYVPPAGCSSPPKAKESPDCGVRYGHARMEFERQWALGQLR
jgi:hypothetical protein